MLSAQDKLTDILQNILRRDQHMLSIHRGLIYACVKQ